MKNIITGLVFILFSVVIITLISVKSIMFNINCSGHLARAADANTIELAINELEVALNYMEENNLTNGYTSVIYKTPDEDVGFWYNNIKASYDELKSIDENSSVLEKSNALLKLRETLLSKGEKSEYVTKPAGISKYPNNAIFLILQWLCGISLIIGFVFLMSGVYDL